MTLLTSVLGVTKMTDWMNLDLKNTGRDLGNLDSGVSSTDSMFAGLNLTSSAPKEEDSSGGFMSAWKKQPWFSSKDNTTGQFQQGKLGEGISMFTGLANAYLGWQQFNLAKDQMAQNKKIFNLNFANQAQSVNTQLEDRQRARVASSGGSGAYESTDAYMKKNAISGKGI
jgi:hypothetical protein